MSIEILKDRLPQIYRKGQTDGAIACDRASLAGSVSQRACVFCGSRVVLYPIADALHLVHDRIGAGRIRLLGYEGTHQLFDRIVNALIEHQQDAGDVGYTHM